MVNLMNASPGNFIPYTKKNTINESIVNIMKVNLGNSIPKVKRTTINTEDQKILFYLPRQ